MAELTKIALDAMGGDNAPVEMVKGAVDAVSREKNIKVFLVGQEEVVKRELKNYTYDADRLEVVNATEVIETAEPPVNAIRRKKDSSIVVGMKMVRAGEADAFVSAGSSGAVLVGGQTIVGRIKGVERPPLAPLIPTEKGVSLLIDCGANVDARPSHLVQFAKMGSIYMEHVMGVKNPKVAIVNIGAEEEKGNALVKETFPLLKAGIFLILLFSHVILVFFEKISFINPVLMFIALVLRVSFIAYVIVLIFSVYEKNFTDNGNNGTDRIRENEPCN